MKSHYETLKRVLREAVNPTRPILSINSYDRRIAPYTFPCGETLQGEFLCDDRSWEQGRLSGPESTRSTLHIVGHTWGHHHGEFLHRSFHEKPSDELAAVMMYRGVVEDAMRIIRVFIISVEEPDYRAFPWKTKFSFRHTWASSFRIYEPLKNTDNEKESKTI